MVQEIWSEKCIFCPPKLGAKSPPMVAGVALPKTVQEHLYMILLIAEYLALICCF